MILGLGIDVFAVSRMERVLREGDPGLLRALFTAREIAHCQQQPHAATHYAACFALKEATFKALAPDGRLMARWRDIEIRPTASGRRAVLLHGRTKAAARRLGVRRILISLTHARGLAAASAVLES